MIKLYHTSIVVRCATIVVGIVLIVSVLFALTTRSLARASEREQLSVRMGELLKTVESTASIACYLQDKNLAAEVSRGLMKNHIVSRVTIRDRGMVLAQEGVASVHARGGADALSASQMQHLTRNVASPFNPKETVCQIVLEPNEAVITEQVARASQAIVSVLLLQALAVAIAVVFVVLNLIAKPIKKISDQLHALQAETGQQLELAATDKGNEIGRMVGDVNSLITNLVAILGQERELRQWREREEKKFRLIFENAETGMFVIDASGEFQSHNPAFRRIMGIPAERAQDEFVEVVTEIVGEDEARVRALMAAAHSGEGVVSDDFRLVYADHERAPKWVSVVFNLVEDGMLQGLVNDISDRKRVEEAAHRLAMTDPLTGIANRLGFDLELARLADTVPTKPGHAIFLMMIDLDWFKQVNDTYGHDAGDEVLRYFARLLKRTLRDTDFMARLGGDEFVVLFDATTESGFEERVAQKIIQEIARPIPVGDGVEVTIGTSIGIASTGGAALNKETLVKHADEAMYRSKQAGRNRFAVYGK
jgi:diguanylate cyclase (GGDEF)-like protein/PAS domain S-box-containing protein